MAYLFLALAFSFNAAANVLLKVAAARGFSFAAVLRGAWTSAEWIALAAGVLFALNLGAYLVALERIPLSVGYPIMIGMTFVIITGATLYLGERITTLHAIGMALILLGIFIIVRATA